MEQQNIFQKIKALLNEDFVFVDEVARILGLSFEGQKFVILYGPGGHAKSEMLNKIKKGLGIEDQTFTQFFGEGTTMDSLFGGLNFKKFNEESILEYFPERSFLNYEYAVFEEMFDAPAVVLTALKDVLTSGELRNGAQTFKMKTKVIIALTNKEPGEISDIGQSAHALIERFPLQLNVKWKDYSAASYLELFKKVAGRLGGPVMNGFKSVLAEILAKATAEGNFVSPRTAVHAFQICQTAAKLRGADHVDKQDMTELRFLPGLEGLAETIQGELTAAMDRAEAEKNLQAAEETFAELISDVREGATPMTLLKAAKKLIAFGDDVSALKITDGLAERRKKLRDSVGEKIQKAQEWALENTRV